VPGVEVSTSLFSHHFQVLQVVEVVEEVEATTVAAQPTRF